MSRGPAASPSSQIVTKRTLPDLLPLPPLRSSIMLPATGTTEIHVKVLQIMSILCGYFVERTCRVHCEGLKRKERCDTPSIC